MLAPDWLTARPIAHRGLHDKAAGRIENSASAASAAIDKGFAIECDVQLTSDGEAMVFHDFTLDRLTGATGRVDARPASELAGIALTGSTDTIPTLSAFLQLLAGRVPLVLEIKSRFDGDTRLTDRVAAVVMGYEGPVAIKSFDPAIVARLRQLTPDRPRGIVAQSAYDYAEWQAMAPQRKHALANLLHFEESQPDFVSWRVKDLPCAAPYLARHLGRRPLMTWTVRTLAERTHAQAHADQMVFEGFVP